MKILSKYLEDTMEFKKNINTTLAFQLFLLMHKKIEEIEFHDVFQDMPSSQLIMPKKEVKEIQQIQRQHSGLPLLSKLLL